MNLHRFRCLVSLFIFYTLTSAALQAQENSSHASASKMKYPKTKTVDVIDDYHGRKVSDPYRWLEDTESEQTAEARDAIHHHACSKMCKRHGATMRRVS